MAPTSTFGPDDRHLPAGAPEAPVRDADWYARKFGTTPEIDEDGNVVVGGRNDGPDNNGINEHDEAAATVFETTDDLLPGENQEGGRLEVSTPIEIIDATNPVAEHEASLSGAREEDLDTLPADAGEYDPSLEIQREDQSYEEPQAPAEAPELPPVTSEVSSETDVVIDAQTDVLQEESNAPTETAVPEQTEGAEQVEIEVPAPANTPEVELKAVPNDKAPGYWTVAELDAWAADLEGYPATETKPAKVAFVEDALKEANA